MFNLFVDHFNAVEFFNPVLSLSVSEFCFRDRASFPFLMAVICSPSCIVAALALRRVSVQCLLTKNGTRNFLKFSYSWNWFCCLPAETVVIEQLNSTNCHIRLFRDNAFAFNFPNGVLKLLIMNLKPIQKYFVGMRLDEDLCFNKLHRFWKQFLKQSNCG